MEKVVELTIAVADAEGWAPLDDGGTTPLIPILISEMETKEL